MLRCMLKFVTGMLLVMVGGAMEPANPFAALMQKAAAHAKAHGAKMPALSPNDATILDG